jgi:hypothetical protein
LLVRLNNAGHNLTEGKGESGGNLIWVAFRVEPNCIKGWHESGREGENVSAISEEDQKGKVVAKNPFKKASNGQKDTAEEDGTWHCSGRKTAGSTPAHYEIIRSAKRVLL